MALPNAAADSHGCIFKFSRFFEDLDFTEIYVHFGQEVC